MASPIAVNNISGYTPAESASSATFAHNVSSEKNRILIVGVGYRNASTDGDITGITFNGVALTKISEQTGESGAELWYLLNPDSGSHNIVVTASGSIRGWGVGAVDLYNCNQNDPINTYNIGAGSGSPNVSVTTDEDECMIVDMFSHRYDGNRTPGAGQTQIYQGEQYNDRFGASYKYLASAGATNMSWSGSSDTWSQIVAAFNTAPPSAGNRGYVIG